MNNTEIKFLFGIKALDDFYGGLTAKDVVMIRHADINIKSIIGSHLQTAAVLFYRGFPQDDKEAMQFLEIMEWYWLAAQGDKRKSPVIHFLNGPGYPTGIVEYASLLIWIDKELERSEEGKHRYEVTAISQKEAPTKFIIEF